MYWNDHTPSYNDPKRSINKELWEVGVLWFGVSIRSPLPPISSEQGKLISTKPPTSSSLLLLCGPDIFNSADGIMKVIQKVFILFEAAQSRMKGRSEAPKKHVKGRTRGCLIGYLEVQGKQRSIFWIYYQLCGGSLSLPVVIFTALLRCDLHTLKFTNYKCTIKLFLVVLKSCATVTINQFRTFRTFPSHHMISP